jgi:LPXTG-motif cell wall-anchored protein
MRKFLRILVLGLGIAVSAIPAATAAAAQPYPIVAPNLTVSPTTVTVGGTVTVSGTGFEPNESVDVTVTYRAAALGHIGRAAHAGLPMARAVVVTADASGNFTTDVTLTQVGTAVITATGLTSGASASATVTVLAGGEALPITGDNGTTLLILLIGSAVLASGLVLVVLTRSRRKPSHTET